jgi:P4 family phage/plasmid primase-like protien
VANRNEPRILNRPLAEPPDEDLWAGEDVLPVHQPRHVGNQPPPVSIDRLIRGDHVELGERLRRHFETDGTLAFADDALWQCNGKQYFEKLDDAEVSRRVHAFAGAAVALKTNKPLTLKQSDVRGATAVLKDMVGDPEFFRDAAPGISFTDCFVGLSPEGTLIKAPNGPQNRARHQLPFDYVPNALPSRRLLNFFGDCFAGCPDASERVECVRELVGLCLLGKGTLFHRALIFHGSGANGKSVLLSLIRRAFPETAIASVPAQSWSHEYSRARLSGKRINIVNELPEGDIIDSSSFKAIVAGDLTMARQPYGRVYDFIPEAGHLFAANTLPGTTDQTDGFWRRFVLIGFPNTVAPENQNPNLAEELAATDLPAFVGWCLAGAQAALSRNSLTIPASSPKAVSEWRRESDQVALWLEERTRRVAPGDGDLASYLYQSYRSWAEQNGHKRLSSTSFGKRLRLLGLEPSHTWKGAEYPIRVVLDNAT